MKFIDMHCDSVMYAYFHDNEDCYETTGMCDVKKLKAGDALTQYLGIFLPQPTSPAWERFNKVYTTDEDYLQACLKIFNATMKNHADIITQVRTGSDVEAAAKEGKMGALLTVEDGRDIQGNMDRLQLYHDWGVRLISLTWNHKNCFGSPNSKDPAIMAEGLTPFGKEAVERMNELGMLVDVSHLSDGGFWDVEKISKKPFVASHSNARALSPHPRCMTDDMIRAVAKHGGVIGLNFMPEFLHEDTVSKQSTVELMVKHAKHIVNVGGIDVLGIGTDFDGFSGELEIAGPDEMYKLFDGLQKAGFSEAEIEKIAYKNSLRVMKDVLG